MSTSTRNRKETEQKIYDAFLSLLEEKGFKAVGINAVAKKAAVSKELIYRYYDGLQGILLRYAKEGDFFKFVADEQIKAITSNSSSEDFKAFVFSALQEFRNQTQTQEILKWQLIENDEKTKELFRFVRQQIESVFQSKVTKDSDLHYLMPVLAGGFIYLTLLSKIHRYFLNHDLHHPEFWAKTEEAVAKVIDSSNL